MTRAGPCRATRLQPVGDEREPALEQSLGELDFVAVVGEGARVVADGSDDRERLAGGPSALFDAVALLVSGAHVAALTRDASALAFVIDALIHGKFIGYVDDAAPLLEEAGDREPNS